MRDVTYQGQAYGLVYGPDLRVMYVSVDKYRANGLDPDKPPATWDELEQAIARVHRGGRGSDIEHLGFDPFLGSGGVGRWLVPFWQLGGELLSPDDQKATFDNEKGIQALTWLKKVADAQGGYQKMLDFQRGTTANQLFLDNKVSHYYATYAERAQEFRVKAPGLQYAFTGYPLPPNGRRANYGGGHTFPLAAGSKAPDTPGASSSTSSPKTTTSSSPTATTVSPSAPRPPGRRSGSATTPSASSPPTRCPGVAWSSPRPVGRRR